MYSITSGKVPQRNRLISEDAHLIMRFVTHFHLNLTSVPLPCVFGFAAVFLKLLNHLSRRKILKRQVWI